jgi:antibiotic biosynthesis monooxygenase (ABM) superfamily enzyme
MKSHPAPIPVRRIAHRRAKPNCGAAYEALLRGMFVDMQNFTGFLGAEILPPETPDGEYQVIVRWATPEALAAWDASPAHMLWLQRLETVAEGNPEYRVLTGMEAWFALPAIPGTGAPSRLKMALVTWLGIFPTVALLQATIAPLFANWPFLLRIATFTVLVVIVMTWLVMPWLTRLLRPLLMPRKPS